MTRACWLATLLAAILPGQTVATPRIVSLAPNLTEIAYAAGAGPALVGTVEFSDYPAAARDLPRVGDAWSVDIERVLSMRPDVVLAWSSGTAEATIERLRAVGLEVVQVETFRLVDVPAALRQLGALAGSTAVAESAARRFAADVERLRARFASARPLTVFIQVDDSPLFTVNGRHVISEVVELCGGLNIFAELPQVAPTVDVESVLARDPEVILGTDDTIEDPAAGWRRWPRLTAVRYGTIYALPADTVTRATPRLADGAEAVCEALEDARGRLPAAVGQR